MDRQVVTQRDQAVTEEGSNSIITSRLSLMRGQWEGMLRLRALTEEGSRSSSIISRLSLMRLLEVHREREGMQRSSSMVETKSIGINHTRGNKRDSVINKPNASYHFLSLSLSHTKKFFGVN